MYLVTIATDTLSQQICGPLYASNTTLSSVVSGAIASATPIAIAATKGKNVTNQLNWPLCAVCRNCDVAHNANASTKGLIRTQLTLKFLIAAKLSKSVQSRRLW